MYALHNAFLYTYEREKKKDLREAKRVVNINVSSASPRPGNRVIQRC